MTALLAVLMAMVPVADQIPPPLPEGVVVTANLDVKAAPSPPPVEAEPESRVVHVERQYGQAEAPPEPEPEPTPQHTGEVPEPWLSLAVCESGMNGVPRWDVNTGNGYRGGLQFAGSTWRAFGGEEFAPYANQATPLQQIEVAERVLAVQGWGAWPSCSSKLGLR